MDDETRARIGSWFGWMFRDRETGRITLFHFPNVPLWIFLATVVLGWFIPTDTAVGAAVDWVGLGALSWWAIDELLRGVNPWRRLLGLAGCALAASQLASFLR